MSFLDLLIRFETISRDAVRKLVRFDDQRWKLTLGNLEIAPMHDYFLPSLFHDLERQIGPVARTLVIRYATHVGLKDGENLRKAMEASGVKVTLDAAVQVVRNFLTLWCLLGWGRLRRVELVNGKLIAERTSSYEAEGYLKLGLGKARSPRCWIALGYVIGVTQGILGRRVEGEETKCIAMGDDTCTFEITIP